MPKVVRSIAMLMRAFGMASSKFVVAADDAWDAVLGVLPQTEELTGDDLVREVRCPINAAEELHLTWDITDRSVRIRYRRDQQLVLDAYRECVTLLTTETVGSERFVVVEFEAGDSKGRCRVRVVPAFAFADSVLR